MAAGRGPLRAKKDNRQNQNQALKRLLYEEGRKGLREGMVDMDKGEFTRRVLAMENRLYRVSCCLLPEHQDRLDAAQEAVLRAWEKVDRLWDPKRFEPWLLRILTNVCYDMLRARSRLTPLDALGEWPAPEGQDLELRQAIQRLDPSLRLVVALRYMDGYKLREIAQILDISIGTVKSRLLRAKGKLKAQLEEREDWS